MENVVDNSKWKWVGLDAFRKPKYPKLDITELEAQRIDMETRVENLRKAVLNGEDEWMLCLTKNPKACKEEDKSDE
jgi:hypothetical protein